jgi:hypothetical protein
VYQIELKSEQMEMSETMEDLQKRIKDLTKSQRSSSAKVSQIMPPAIEA